MDGELELREISDKEVNKHAICHSEEAENDRPRPRLYSSHVEWP